jgi:hypothetical protein
MSLTFSKLFRDILIVPVEKWGGWGGSHLWDLAARGPVGSGSFSAAKFRKGGAQAGKPVQVEAIGNNNNRLELARHLVAYSRPRGDGL